MVFCQENPETQPTFRPDYHELHPAIADLERSELPAIFLASQDGGDITR